MKKSVLIVALLASFIAVFPLSVRLADPFFTYPFHKDWDHSALLIWPDRVEARSLNDVAEVSPRPRDATYVFMVAPEREAWVKEQVRRLPSPTGSASWTLHVKQLGASRQEIRFELPGDGISGLIYDAQPDKIIPLRSRLSGPEGAFVILAAHLALWGSGWILFWVGRRIKQAEAIIGGFCPVGWRNNAADTNQSFSPHLPQSPALSRIKNPLRLGEFRKTYDSFSRS